MGRFDQAFDRQFRVAAAVAGIDAVAGVQLAEKLERRMRPLDEAARTAIQQWPFSVIEVDGVAIECQAVIPMQFALDRPKPDMPDLAPYRARLGDACPASPALLTPVAETLL